MYSFDTDTRTIHGHEVTVTWYHDDTNGSPWENEDGHGSVSDWTTRDKRGGELVLCSDRSRKRYYDFQEACAISLRDGWDAEPFNTGSESKRQQAAKAARADYEWLRQWCNDEWHYVGYSVSIEGFDYDESLWGIDSPSMAEFRDEAFDNAEAWLKDELAESEAMAARDIQTV